jgi:hypothetical protein
VFFVITGLNVDITGLGLDGLVALGLILLVACSGKFLGAMLASRSQGVPIRQAAALGVLMNTRGLTELVILTIGREVGVLNDDMFTIMVCMAVFTTVITEPLLRLLYPDELVQREIDEAERIGSDEALAYRVLVGTPEGEPGPVLARLAASLTAGEEPREVALVQFGEAGAADLEVGGGIEQLATSLDALHHLELAVADSGAPVFARSRTTDDPGRLLGLLADENVADVVLVPDDATFQPPGGTQAPAAPTARVRRPGEAALAGPVAVHLRGTADDVHALDLAVRLATARSTALVVVKASGSPGRKVNAALERLRGAGLVGEPSGTPSLEVHSGDAPPAADGATALSVRGGRDDGLDRLTALVDRLGHQPAAPLGDGSEPA